MKMSHHPNRKYLMKLREDINIANSGKEILQEKIDALIVTFFKTIDDRNIERKQLDSLMEAGLRDILLLEMMIGTNDLEMESYNDDTVTIINHQQKVMGLVLDRFTVESKRNDAFFDGPLKLDEAKSKFIDILDKTIKVGEIENNIKKMFKEIRRIRRITGSLDNYIIPELKLETLWIEERIGQMGREDVLRYKMMKKKMGIL